MPFPNIQNEMKKPEFLIILVIIFMAVNAFAYRIWSSSAISSDQIELLQAVILFWTGAILLWYTWETWRLRKESQRQVQVAQRQLELQIQPFILIKLESRVNNSRDINLLIKNCGESIAFSVKYCVSNRDVILNVGILEKGGSRIRDSINIHGSEFTSMIIFSNINNEKYYVAQEFREGDHNIRGFGRLSAIHLFHVNFTKNEKHLIDSMSR